MIERFPASKSGGGVLAGPGANDKGGSGPMFGTSAGGLSALGHGLFFLDRALRLAAGFPPEGRTPNARKCFGNKRLQ